MSTRPLRIPRFTIGSSANGFVTAGYAVAAIGILCLLSACAMVDTVGNKMGFENPLNTLGNWLHPDSRYEERIVVCDLTEGQLHILPKVGDIYRERIVAVSERAQAYCTLQFTSPGSQTVDLRIRKLDGTVVRTAQYDHAVIEGPFPENAFALSPTGDTLAYACTQFGQAGLWSLDLDTSVQTMLVPEIRQTSDPAVTGTLGEYPMLVEWLSDTQVLLVLPPGMQPYPSSVVMVTLPRNDLTILYQVPDKGRLAALHGGFSRDHTRVAIMEMRGSLRSERWDIKTLDLLTQEVFPIASGTGDVTAPCLNPDGNRIVWVEGLTTVMVHSLPDKQTKTLKTLPDGWVTPLTFICGDRLLCRIDGYGTTRMGTRSVILDSETGQEWSLPPGDYAYPFFPMDGGTKILCSLQVPRTRK